MITYALIDADGSFDSAGRDRSYVHAVYDTADAAQRASKKMMQVQCIQGNDLEKGEIIYRHAVGRTYPRVAI